MSVFGSSDERILIEEIVEATTEEQETEFCSGGETIDDNSVAGSVVLAEVSESQELLVSQLIVDNNSSCGNSSGTLRGEPKHSVVHHVVHDETEVAQANCRLVRQNGSHSISGGGGGRVTPRSHMEQEKRMRREIANSNERRRMQSINAGFQSLRTLLPHHEGEKLSKAAILQQTAEYIYQLEQEKTQLLSQNCHLKRLVNQHEGGDVPIKKRKAETQGVVVSLPMHVNESGDEGLGSMSPEPMSVITVSTDGHAVITSCSNNNNCSSSNNNNTNSSNNINSSSNNNNNDDDHDDNNTDCSSSSSNSNNSNNNNTNTTTTTTTTSTNTATTTIATTTTTDGIINNNGSGNDNSSNNNSSSNSASSNDVAELRRLLERERQQRLHLEKQMRAIQTQLYPERFRDNQLIAYQPHEVIEHTDNVMVQETEEAVAALQVVSVVSLPPVGSTQTVETSNPDLSSPPLSPQLEEIVTADIKEEEADTDSTKIVAFTTNQVFANTIEEEASSVGSFSPSRVTYATSATADFKNCTAITVATPQFITASPTRPFSPSPEPQRLPSVLEAAIKAEPKVEVERLPSPANSLDDGTPQGRLYLANTSRQNLETIVEAIRHLEGDHLFSDEPAQDVPLALTNKPTSIGAAASSTKQRLLHAEVNNFLQFHTKQQTQQRPGVIVVKHS